ncbi:MAG: hypothetical protein ACYTG0_33015 [Planctomycetota bacterium]|jgi:hypothetical protein
MLSVDSVEIEPLRSEGRWEEDSRLLADAAIRLKTAGADFIVFCTNTMHKVADRLEAAVEGALRGRVSIEPAAFLTTWGRFPNLPCVLTSQQSKPHSPRRSSGTEVSTASDACRMEDLVSEVRIEKHEARS